MANDDKCTALACRDPLEKLLERKEPLSDDIDVRDFLIYAGVDYFGPSYRASTRPDLKAEARARARQRRADSSPKENSVQSRIRGGIISNGDRYRTVAEMRDKLETGRRPRYMGKESFGRLNELLVEYGLRPIGPRRDGYKRYWE